MPDNANEAVITNLACRIGPMYGKQIAPATMVHAKRAYDAMMLAFCLPPEMQLPSMPAGAGNKPWRWDDAFTPGPGNSLNVGPDGPLEFN